MSNTSFNSVDSVNPESQNADSVDPSKSAAAPPIDLDAHRDPLPPTAPNSSKSDRRGLSIWLFVLVVVLFSLALGWQFQATGELEQEIAGLEQELSETTALLGAHKGRLVEIRTGVRDLVGQLAGLQALVDAEPVAKAPASVGSTDSASSRRSAEGRRSIPARLPE